MLLIIAVALLVVGGAAGADAGKLPPDRLMERLNRMTLSERRSLLSKLPPERRSLVEQRLERLDRMPPEARRQLGHEYAHFQQLPEDKQNVVRRLFQEFSALPGTRRSQLRRELVHLRAMSPGSRAERLSSDAFGTSYNDRERQLLRSLLDVLPATRTEEPPSDPAPTPARRESDR